MTHMSTGLRPDTSQHLSGVEAERGRSLEKWKKKLNRRVRLRMKKKKR